MIKFSYVISTESPVTELVFVLPAVARGDTFEETDGVTETVTTTMIESTPKDLPPTFNTIAETTTAYPQPPTTQGPQTTQGPTPPVDPDSAVCSGEPFDAFLQLKNGSIYAFRGKSGAPKEFVQS